MTPTKTAYEHIVFNQDGIPLIDGTTMKVIELVLETQAHGWSPEELRFQHPYLSLGQIHSALAFYWDHQGELDNDIEQRLRKVNALRQAQPASPLVARLKAQGLL
jgi:uncharacterized protein (DUF433 family)